MEAITISRKEQLQKFINSYFNNNDNLSLQQLKGDASVRKYFRIVTENKSYIVMDCPPGLCKVEPFIKIAKHFSQIGISAPEIIHTDIKNGFIILEDFGDITIKQYIEQKNDKNFKQEFLYLIIDLLIIIQNNDLPNDLKLYDNQALIKELDIFLSWYPQITGKILTDSEISEYKDIWQHILSLQEAMPKTLVFRDYHTENMMHLATRGGINQLGLLDFQDAVIGSPIYDLVSILEDARIEIERDLAINAIQYFANKKNLDYNQVLLNYHILGAQRNSRILGVFVKKSIGEGNDNYLKYIPLLLKYLEYDLSHTKLKQLKLIMKKLFLNS
ncbi:MAG: phosphotransferase [Rickettsiaceae bacterium]|nr:phosphotransferase [Rickettsiaceae bacterium]